MGRSRMTHRRHHAHFRAQGLNRYDARCPREKDQRQRGQVMRRREFISLIGSAAVWPRLAHGQQTAAPAVGFLSSLSLAQGPHFVSAFRRGLSETGFVEGKNTGVDYQFADGQYGRLTAMAAELVHKQVNVLVTAGPPAANAA